MAYRKGAPKPGDPGYWTEELLAAFESQPTFPGETQYEKAIRLQAGRGGRGDSGIPSPSSIRQAQAQRQEALARAEDLRRAKEEEAKRRTQAEAVAKAQQQREQREMVERAITRRTRQDLAPSFVIPARREEDISLRDVSLVKTFFPDIAEEKGIGEKKITLQTFVETKGQKILRRAGKKVTERLPEGKIRALLEKEVSAPTLITDISKFVFFLPALKTTQEALGEAIARGDITPIVETQFKATIKQVDDIARVDVASVSKSGGRTSASISRQLAKDVGDDITFGIGRGVRGTLKGRKVEFKTFEVAGAGRRVGGARIVQQLDDSVKIARELGTGVESRVLTRDVSKIIQRRGIGGITTKADLPKFSEAKFNLGNIKFKLDIQKSDLTGVLIKSDLDENILRFVGTTQKPTTLITKEGISKKIFVEDINVRGIIKTLDPSKEIITFGGRAGRGFLAQDVQTPLISQIGVSLSKSMKVFQKDIAKDVSRVITRQAVKTTTPAIVSTRIRPSPKAEIKPQINIKQIEKQAFTDQTQITKFADQTSQRFGDLGVLAGRLASGVGEKEAQRDIAKVRTKLKLKQIPKQKPKQMVDVAQRVVQRQGQRLKSLLKLQLKQRGAGRGRVPFIPIVPILKFPKVPVVPFGFKLPKAKRLKKRRERFAGVDSIIFSQDFLSKVVNLPIRKISIKKARAGLIREPFLIGRGIPVLVNDFDIPRRKTKRRKKRK